MSEKREYAGTIAKQMFEVFTIMQQLHELLWYLTEALTLQPARLLHGELSRALDAAERLTHNSADTLMELNVTAHRRDVNALLLRTSELVRAEARRPKKDYRGADLMGADLRGADLTESIFLIQSSSMQRRAVMPRSCRRRSLAPHIGSL